MPQSKPDQFVKVLPNDRVQLKEKINGFHLKGPSQPNLEVHFFALFFMETLPFYIKKITSLQKILPKCDATASDQLAHPYPKAELLKEVYFFGLKIFID